jgi:hypothetical protein
LRSRLAHAQEELAKACEQISDLGQQLFYCKRDLRLEREMNKTALEFIAEDVMEDYLSHWPNRQNW